MHDGARAQPVWVPCNALVAVWKQVPSAMFQHLVETLPRRVEAVILAKGDQLHINANDFGMRCSTSRCPHTFGHVVWRKTVIYAVIWGINNSKKRWNVLLQHTVNYGVLWGNCCISNGTVIPSHRIQYHTISLERQKPFDHGIAWYCCFWLINIFWGVPCKRLFLLHPMSENAVPIILLCG
jgi:hypothetical protein